MMALGWMRCGGCGGWDGIEPCCDVEAAAAVRDIDY